MDSADLRRRSQDPQSDAHVAPPPERTEEKHGRFAAGAGLTDDIDDLRQKMAEIFLKEASFTADPVILISRQLDQKINEYMKQWNKGRKKAR